MIESQFDIHEIKIIKPYIGKSQICEKAWAHHASILKITSKSLDNHQYINIIPLKSI